MYLKRMPEIHCGEDALQALGGVLDSLAVRRVFLVTGPHVSCTEGFAQILDTVASDGRVAEVFAETKADPSIQQVDEMAARARAFGADAVIGVGGGSPLDAAKVVAVLLTEEGSSAGLVGVGRVHARRVPLILVPTTAGTGSEVTEYSILTNTETQMKAAVCSTHIIPDYAFLVPAMTYSMPPSVTAVTGMDALCHATEACLSKKRNPYSDLMALEAVRLIGANLRVAYREPSNTAAREAMLMASLYAGLAFGNASVTAVHAFAYPLGGMHHVAHGMANSLMFAPVFNHNLAGNEGRFAALAAALCGVADAERLVPAVQDLQRDLGLPLSLAEAGIPEGDLEAMSQSVMGVRRLLDVNPNEISLDDARRIYREAYDGP
jgi:alcohol dehydrogenase class IV